MRLLNDKKGAIRVIEAFFASVIVLSCLVLIPTVVTSRPETENLMSRAENVLLSLDKNGKLGNLVDNHDWTGIQQCLESALPLTFWFNLTVYDKNMNVLNDYQICNTGAVSQEVVSVNYVCASQNSNYAIYVLQLQLAGVD